MKLKPIHYFNLLLFLFVIILSGGCKDDTHNKVSSITLGNRITYKNGTYCIMGGVRNHNLSIITIRSADELPSSSLSQMYLGFIYSYCDLNKGILLQTPLFPALLIKPGYDGLFYFKGENITFYQKKFDPKFLMVFFEKLDIDQGNKTFDISEFCKSVGINKPPVQLNKVFTLRPLPKEYDVLAPFLEKREALTTD